VHAISDEAKRFYERHGFVESRVDPMTLMITVAEAKKPWAGFYHLDTGRSPSR